MNILKPQIALKLTYNPNDPCSQEQIKAARDEWIAEYEKIASGNPEKQILCNKLANRISHAAELLMTSENEEYDSLDGAFPLGNETDMIFASPYFNVRELAVIQAGLANTVEPGQFCEYNTDVLVRRGFLAEAQGRWSEAVHAYRGVSTSKSVQDREYLCRRKANGEICPSCGSDDVTTMDGTGKIGKRGETLTLEISPEMRFCNVCGTIFRAETESAKKTYTEEEFETLWKSAEHLFDQNPEKGYLAWLALSELGYARAAHSVGWCLRYGNGAKQNTEKAKEYYRRAVDGGYDISYASLFGMEEDVGNLAEAHKIAMNGAKNGSSQCYLLLATECELGQLFGGNSRASAYCAARAYEIDRKNGHLLGYYYLNGFYFPKVYAYAKYCIENSRMTKEELEECGAEFPEYWDEIEPVEPKYPDFGLTLETCEGAVNPEKLMERVKALMFAEVPDDEAAKPLVLEAARAGLSQAMFYAYMLDIDGCNTLLIRGADEYGDADCIESIAVAFSDGAIYKIGNPALNEAIKYWNRRKKLHGKMPLQKWSVAAYERYSLGLDKLFGRTPREALPDANAVLLRTDGSHKTLKVDFDSLDGLYAPIGCERINTISTQRLKSISDKLGFPIVMYCDERGMHKQLPENPVAANLSGYDVIWGDVVICGFTNDYAPLYKDEIEEVLGLLDAQ